MKYLWRLYKKNNNKYVFVDCYYLKYNGVVNHNISYENDQELKDLYNQYYEFFREEIKRNNLTIFFN